MVAMDHHTRESAHRAAAEASSGSAPGPVPDPAPDPAPDVALLVREGCHLCDEAEATVARVCDRLGLTWRTLDVTTEPELARRHDEEIPVLFVDGIQRDFWRVDPVRLERLLTADRS